MRIKAVAAAVSLVVSISMLTVIGCGRDTQVGPSNEEFAQARQELVSKLKKGKKAPKQAKGPKAKSGKPTDQTFAALEKGFRYDATGKRDPFRSFEWEQLKRELFAAGSRGPLEQFDVSQLTVLGVVWNDSNARALIEDPSGMTYIVGEGARIGKNEGRVVQIDDNIVVVKETYVDSNFEETTRDIEMRIRPTEGG